jgi:hypothetical protein
MTVDTGHFLFPQRMVRKKIIFRLDLWVAAETELRHLFPTHFLLWSLVQLMAVYAADIVQRMGTGIPVSEYGGGNGGMALEADERLCLRREVLDIQERAGVALHVPRVIGCHITGDPGDGKASSPMARFAVYQRETIFRPDLFPVHAVPEVVGNLVMSVTFGYAVIGTDVFCVKSPDNHSFIIPNGKYCPVFSQPGTGNATDNRQEHNNKYRVISVQDLSSGITDHSP